MKETAPVSAVEPSTEQSLTAEQLIAAFMLDAPIPINRLYGLYGKRSTFHVWKKLGLDVKPITGMGPTVIPSAFKVFLLRQRGDWKPTLKVVPTPPAGKRRAK